MVDPTKNISQIPGVNTVGKTQAAGSVKRADEKKEAGGVSDSVEISSEASEAQANDNAAKTRVLLEKNHKMTLGLNPSLLDESV